MVTSTPQARRASAAVNPVGPAPITTAWVVRSKSMGGDVLLHFSTSLAPCAGEARHSRPKIAHGIVFSFVVPARGFQDWRLPQNCPKNLPCAQRIIDALAFIAEFPKITPAT